MSGSLTVSISSTPLQLTAPQFTELANAHKGGLLNEIFAGVNPADFSAIAQLNRLFNRIIWHPGEYYETIPTLNFRRWLCDKLSFEITKNSKGEILEKYEKDLPENLSEEEKQKLSKEFANLVGLEGLLSKHYSDLNSSFYYENNLTNSNILKLLHVQMDTEFIRLSKCLQKLLFIKNHPLQVDLMGIMRRKKTELKAFEKKCKPNDKKNIAQTQQIYANRMNPVHQQLLQTRPPIAPLALAPPPINPIHQAARSRKIELLQRVVGIIAAAGSTWSFHWIDYVDESWKGVAALTHVGVSIAALMTLIPRSSGQPPQRFWHYRNYATITSSIATFVCMGGAIFPRLISYTLPTRVANHSKGCRMGCFWFIEL